MNRVPKFDASIVADREREATRILRDDLIRIATGKMIPDHNDGIIRSDEWWYKLPINIVGFVDAIMKRRAK